MFKTIEKIRQKPEKTKKQIAFLTALSLVGIIFVIWLTVVYPDFKQTRDTQEKVANIEPSPISSFFDSMANGFSAIGEQVTKLKDAVSVFSSDPTHYVATSTATSTSQ